MLYNKEGKSTTLGAASAFLVGIIVNSYCEEKPDLTSGVCIYSSQHPLARTGLYI